MEWVNLAIFILFIVILAIFVVESVRLRVVNRKLFAKLVQSELDRNAISDKLNKIILEHSAEKTDGFLRFVSDSREKAFEYIEEVQDALKVFDEEIGGIVKHYKNTGKSATRKTNELLKKVEMAYDIIMTLAPKEEVKKENSDQE